MAGTPEIARENGKKGGRPKGSPNFKPFREYVNETDRKTFIEFILSSYMGDMRLAVWLGEQLFGKAPQAITGADGGPVQITVTKYAGDKPTPPLQA